MPDRYLGQQLGDYIAEERIGRGAMAVVYRAYQPSLQRDVALKVIKLDIGLGDDGEFRRRFAQEAELIASLEHIHILPVFDYGISSEGENAFIAMRLLRGGTLADLLKEGPIPLDRAADIITQIARGLAYAHRAGIIHRDLKPSNILFDNHGNAYLTDFGLAKALANPDLTKPGHLVGTPAYVPPEALRGESIDHRADIYSLGILTYEILTGRVPFEMTGGSIMALIRMHLEDEPPKMRQFNAAIPPEVEAVVMRALRKDPRQRYADAEEMADALNAALGRRYSTGSNPALRAVHQSRETKSLLQRRQTRGVLTLLAVVLLLGIGWWVINRPPGATDAAPTATVLTGIMGTAADVEPSAEDIAMARQQLSEGGFIAYIACTMESIFQATRARELGDFAAGQGLNYRAYDSEGDPYVQVTQIERARLDGAKAFILCPLDIDLLKPTLEALREATIPVVFVTLFESGYGVMLNADDYATGRASGTLAGDIIRDERGGEANVVILAYPGFPSSERRVQGVRDGLLERAPDATIVGVYRGFTREFGYESIKQLLDAGTPFDVIVSINDAGSFGAIDALREAGLTPDDVAITSANAEPLALDYIAAGNFLRGSVNTNRELGSRIALNAAIRLLAGGTVPEIILFPPGVTVTADRISATPETTASAS